MPSPPSLFDDDEFRPGDPEPRGPEPRNPDTDGDVRRDPSPRDRPAERGAGRPNYLFRRGVVVGGVIAVLAAAAVVVLNARDSASDTAVSGSISADWNRVVVVDLRTGRVVVDNSDGEELDRVQSGVTPIASTRAVGSSLLVVGSNDNGTAVVDIGDGTSTPIEIDATSIELPSGSALTMIAPNQSGSRGVLLNGPEVLDTDEFAPIAGARYEFATARSDPSGRDVLVTDTGNFQSVLFSFDREEPSYVPGLALAIDENLAVTAQNVGNAATVSVFDHAGDLASSATTPSVRAGLINESSIQIVTVDGAVLTMSSASGDTENTDQLDIGTIRSGHVTTSGEQLIVLGSEGTALVGSDGTVIAEFADRFPVETDEAIRASTCIPLIDDAADEVTIAELASGAVRSEAQVAGSFSTTADGCTIAVAVDGGFQVIDDTGTSTIDTEGELVELAPDGSSVILDLDNRLVLAPVDDLSEPLDLGPAGRSVAFTTT